MQNKDIFCNFAEKRYCESLTVREVLSCYRWCREGDARFDKRIVRAGHSLRHALR